MKPDERYERLQACVDALREANETQPVLVEGVRDERALRSLGLPGQILIYNAGKRLGEVADHLAQRHRQLIVLLDWDRTGGHLVQRLREHLSTQVRLDLSYRKELAQVSQVKSVEDLPAALRLWRQRAGLAPRHGVEEEE